MIGIDSNVLVYSLDPTFAEHVKAKRAILSSGECAVNPLVIGCYLHNKIPEMYSHDQDLVGLMKVGANGKTIRITDPIT